MNNKIEQGLMIEFLKNDKIPELLKLLDTIDTGNLFQYTRLKKEYQGGLRGSEFSDWADRMEVFINGLK